MPAFVLRICLLGSLGQHQRSLSDAEEDASVSEGAELGEFSHNSLMSAEDSFHPKKEKAQSVFVNMNICFAELGTREPIL